MRSGWMRLVRTAEAMLALAGGLWAAGAGAAEVKNVTAEYGWPWGAEIRYEVVGTVNSNAPLTLTATDWGGKATYQAEDSALSGDTGNKTGSHRLTWDLDKQGVKIQSTNVVFTAMYEPGYCVVDLSGGENATSYPVTFMDTPPDGGFNSYNYKTTKLVLRRVEAGTFTMGDSSVYSSQPHQVTLKRPFYMGLFEVTQRQWELVMGSNPSKHQGFDYPVEQVSWNDIQGNSNSFIARLQKRTGLTFTLPTEEQWEYTCRAGTTTAYSYGDSPKTAYMWYSLICSSTREVGTRLENPWGFYDMHGNVKEWCLTWLSENSRVIRGGGWSSSDFMCVSAYRSGNPPAEASENIGFRLSMTLAAE